MVEEEKLRRIETEAQHRIQEIDLHKDLERHMRQLTEEVTLSSKQREIELQKRKEAWGFEDKERELKKTV